MVCWDNHKERMLGMFASGDDDVVANGRNKAKDRMLIIRLIKEARKASTVIN
jgi:hypothetical protein